MEHEKLKSMDQEKSRKLHELTYVSVKRRSLVLSVTVLSVELRNFDNCY